MHQFVYQGAHHTWWSSSGGPTTLCAALNPHLGLSALNPHLGPSPPQMWRKAKAKKKSKQESMWERLTASKAKEYMTKDPKTGRRPGGGGSRRGSS